jgi:hypothetical protein
MNTSETNLSYWIHYFQLLGHLHYWLGLPLWGFSDGFLGQRKFYATTHYNHSYHHRPLCHSTSFEQIGIQRLFSKVNSKNFYNRPKTVAASTLLPQMLTYLIHNKNVLLTMSKVDPELHQANRLWCISKTLNTVLCNKL